jgi:hypothetical protein
MPAPVASGWSGWPGGACTRWKCAALSRRTGIADVRLSLVDTAGIVLDLPEAHSLLRQPRLAQAFEEMFSLRQEDGIVAFGPQLEAVNSEFRV